VRMHRLVLVLAVIAAGAVVPAGAVAQAPNPHTCEGYPESRQFVDAQSWWTTTPGKGGDDFGHAHVGACIPERESISTPTALDIRVVLHENPGKIGSLRLVTKTKDQEVIRIKDYSLWGTTCPVGTCEYWRSYTLDPAWFNYSGLQEVRFRLTVNEPDGNTMQASMNWQAYIWNGNPRLDVTRQPWLRGKGWYSGAEYCEAAYKSVPLPDVPVSDVWSPYLKMVWHGSVADLPVTHHTAGLDPDFHNGTRGTILRDGEGPWQGDQPVDPSTLAPGRHRLFMRSDCDDPRGSTNSGVLVVPFTAGSTL
jgi:hypothetical protein